MPKTPSHALSAQELLERFEPLGVKRSGCLLLGPDQVLALLDEIDRNGLHLCGIEGYWLRDSELQPSMENSLYFIGTDVRVAALPGASPIEKARSFVESRRETGLVFDLDLG